MLHLRVIAPADQSTEVVDLLIVAVAAAYGVWGEAGGSALQLVINLCAIVLAGLLTLVVQQVLWWRLARRFRRPATG